MFFFGRIKKGNKHNTINHEIQSNQQIIKEGFLLMRENKMAPTQRVQIWWRFCQGFDNRPVSTVQTVQAVLWQWQTPKSGIKQHLNV